MKSCQRYLSIIVLILVVQSFAIAQLGSSQLQGFEADIVNGKFHIAYHLQSPLPLAVTAQLSYHIVAKTGFLSPEKILSPTASVPANASDIGFDIPLDDLISANKLVFVVRINGATGTLYTSPISELNVSYLDDLKAEKGRTADLSTQLQTALDTIKARDGTIASFNLHTQASNVVWKATPFITDSRIVTQFDLDFPGKLLTTITCQGMEVKTDRSKSISKTQSVSFDGIPENTPCQLEAEILKITDDSKTGVKINGTTDGRLNIRTKARIDNIHLQPTFTAGSDTISVGLVADQAGFVQIDYAELINPTTGDLGEVKHRGQLSTNEFGSPSGEPIKTGPNPFTLDGLKPGKTYSIKVQARNIFGQELATPITTSLATNASPVALAFSKDPLKIEVTPLGVTVTWKANLEPKEAFFEVVFGDQPGDTFTRKATVAGTTVSAILPVDQLAGVIAATKDKKAIPILRVRMTDGGSGQPIIRDTQVSFTLPTDPQKVKDSTLSPDAQKQLTDVMANAKPGKKVNWTNLLLSGLSIFIPLL